MLYWSECINDAPHYHNIGQNSNTQWHDTPLTMCHGPFALPTIQYLKPFQTQQLLGATCCSKYPIAYWNNERLQATPHGSYTMITKLVSSISTEERLPPLQTYSSYDSEPWTITSVHTNGKIRVKRRTKS
jgi:hypothetical protein